MMEMIANYGNPISPQPPPQNRSYEEPNSAELRGPSFQDYLKSSSKETSSSPSQEGSPLEPLSRERESRDVADKAGRDKPAYPAEENRLKESGKPAKREEGRAEAADTEGSLSGKAAKSARWGGQKNGPEISETLLKRGSLPEESEAENALGGHKKSQKETSPVSGKELFAQIEPSPPAGDEKGTEAESLLVSMTGSPAEAVLDETASRRDHRRDAATGDLKGKPVGDGAVKVAGSPASDAARLKIVSADNPENSIEVSLTDVRNRGKADAADRRTSGGEPVKNDEALLNRSEAPKAGEAENGNVRVLELGGDSQERSGTPSAFSAKETKSAAASFGEILREKGISQVVKQTGILLKDDNRGEIKLILKPESLGKVRIQLNLEDNRIAGRILVENSNVRDVFNQNMEELQRALRESGFESAHLEVSVEGEASGQNQEGRRDPLRNQRMIAQAIEDGLPGIITLQREETLVNLMA